MNSTVQVSEKQDRRSFGVMFWKALALGAALWLAGSLGGPGWALAQMGSEHDAGEEEMLTGETAQPRRPSSRTAAIPKPPPEIAFTTRLDRTAVWVGDLFHYVIIVDHSPNIEFVLENLNKETLTMDPLRVIDVAYSSVALKNGQMRLFVDITLTSFAVGAPQQQIPQLTLFYFRKDSTTTGVEQAAAESLTVPGPLLALRSTLPPDPSDLRDAVTVSRWAQSRWVVAGIGWVALVILVTGVGWETATLVRRRKGRRGPDPRKAMAAIHDRWARAVPADFSNPQAVLEFYGRSYQDLKEYLGYLLETPTDGLTAEEMREEMVRRAANPDLTDRAAKVLATCESARYGRNGKEASGDSGRNLAQDMRDIFQMGSRR